MIFFILLLVTWPSYSVIKEGHVAQNIQIQKKKPAAQGASSIKSVVRSQVDLSGKLKNRLSLLLSGMVDAHRYLKTENTKHFKTKVKKLLWLIDSVYPLRESYLSYHQNNHLNLQLKTISDNMKRMVLDTRSSTDKAQDLKKVYRDLVQISGSYDLEKTNHYGIYFCPQDKNVWIQQTDLKAYNPFDNRYRACGRKVR